MSPKENKNNKNNIMESQNTKILLAFLAGLLIGAVVSPLAMGVRGGVEEGENEKENTKNIDVEALNNISVADQLAGDRVKVKEVNFSEFGWAVVHEQNKGVLGNALGAQKFETGAHNDAYIYLLRNSEPENKYYVILYDDNGDFEFDLKIDTPILNLDGNPIMTEFNTVRFDRKTN